MFPSLPRPLVDRSTESLGNRQFCSICCLCRGGASSHWSRPSPNTLRSAPRGFSSRCSLQNQSLSFFSPCAGALFFFLRSRDPYQPLSSIACTWTNLPAEALPRCWGHRVERQLSLIASKPRIHRVHPPFGFLRSARFLTGWVGSILIDRFASRFAAPLVDVMKAYWTAISYMGETTGAFFSYAVEFSLDYHIQHPRYQPFSVYEDYPGAFSTPANPCENLHLLACNARASFF